MSQSNTIREFLSGISSLLTEKGLNYVLSKRKLSGSELLDSLSDREIDLAEGTVYYWLTNLPVGGSTEKVADGGWSHSEGGWTVSKANIDEWRRKYRDLFDKWDEPLLGGSKVRLINF